MLGCSFVCHEVDASEIAWEGGITAIYQHADDSRAEAEVTASADLFATLAMGSGEWLMYIEASTSPGSDSVSAFYPTVNGDARSVLTRHGDGGIQISEFNYTFRSANDRSLMVGLIDPSGWLDRGRIANDENQHFLNGSFVNNATIEFPDYALGAVYRTPGRGHRPEVTIVVSGSDGMLMFLIVRIRTSSISMRTVAVFLSAPAQAGYSTVHRGALVHGSGLTTIPWRTTPAPTRKTTVSMRFMAGNQT